MSEIKNSDEYNEKFKLNNKSGKELIRCTACGEMFYQIGKIKICFWCDNEEE